MRILPSLLALFALTLPGVNAAPLYLNEVFFNPSGTDAPHEYIELRGTAGDVIAAGTYFIGIEGDSGAGPGAVQTIIPLGGLSLGSNGFLVIRQFGNSYSVLSGTTVLTSTAAGFSGGLGFLAQSGSDIENASVTFMLVQSATAPAINDDIDTDNNGTPDGAVFAGWTILDSIGINDPSGGGQDYSYGCLSYNNNTGPGTSITGANVGIGFTASYVARVGNSTGCAVSDWMAADSQGTGPNFTFQTDNTIAELANQSITGTMQLGGTNFAPVPEPSTLVLTAAGVAFLFLGLYRRR